MIQEQRFTTPVQSRGPHGSEGETMHHDRPSHLLRSALIALGVTCILTLVEVGALLLLNPFHVNSFSGRLGTVLTLPVHAPQTLLVPGIELLVTFGAALLAMQPLALVAYLRDVHRAQEAYHTLYIPLTALTNIRQAPDGYQQDASVSTREAQVSILDLVQQQGAHQMILGVPGAGKTMALRVYQYIASQQPFKLMSTRGQIPVYVPMKNYSLFLKKYLPASGGQTKYDPLAVSLLDYLYESDLPGMRHLRPYLQALSQRGRLLLLCDGLNEIDSNYLAPVGSELVDLMRNSRNRLVMTCREVDYREQHDFVQLVNDGQASRAVIYPLLPEQVHEFVERYVERQDQRWQHTAGQIVQVIDRSRLRYHCTNPMMLFTLMGIIDTLGVERGKQIDTRGRLLRESVRQLIAYEQRQPRWSKVAPPEREVIRFLSEVACAARWANDRNAIQLHIATASMSRMNFMEPADELQFWLDEHPASGPFVVDEEGETAEPYDDLSQLLQFAVSASLIEISQGGVVSFRHELIAEYFVAEYFFAATNKKGSAALPMREELLENVGRWSEPVAIWAGLLDQPLLLAERFGLLGRSNPAYVLPALALGLVCVGVLWTPPQADVQHSVMLPTSMEEALSLAVRNRAAREELARIFTRCAEEGGQEVYRSLLPLIMVEGVDDLLALLDQNIVPELLFTHLQDTVDNVAYEAQVKRLTRVLGRFGSVVVERALQLSQPQTERSIRLRAAAVNILGGTVSASAVEPLIERMGDSEIFIVERASNALIRLGPELTLSRLLQELENRTARPFLVRTHRALLLILGRFLEEQDVRRQLTIMQYQRSLDAIVPILTSNYQAEPDVQQLACDLLIRQGRQTTGGGARDNRWEKVIETLLRYLPSHDDVAAQYVTLALQEIGEVATPRLLELLGQSSELVRTRVVDILSEVRDTRALPRLLRLLADPQPALQQHIMRALQVYAPESISGLIDAVFTGSEAIAERAAQVLAAIGEAAVGPVINVLFHIVPGRTGLLVRVLEEIHDVRAVPALITLLQTSNIESLLAVSCIRALCQFSDRRVVAPLLALLAETNPLIYEEAVDALSQLGPMALDGLIAALDVQQETATIPRVRRAILGMVPFPGDELLLALEHSTQVQAQQILAIFRMQGSEAAQVLVKHLSHPNGHVREYITQALNEMPGPVVVPALLEVVHLPSMRGVTHSILLKHPDAAITPLVELLGEHERGDAAAQLLPQFGLRVLRPLLSGLDDPRSMARERSQRIMVALVRRGDNVQGVLRELVRLFSQAPPARAREVLLDVLTNELADVSIPMLLEGLEDAHLIDDVAEACVLLARKVAWRDIVLDSLVQALYIAERRRGAEAALVRIAAPAVPRVGELITDQQQVIASAAKRILREIGVPALAFIWTAHSDKSNLVRREAALEIFHSMRTEVIKDELIALLLSDQLDDISMAVALLLERIRDEATQHYAERVMIPELIEYVQTQGVEKTNLRVLSLLLMLGEQAILDHLLQTLDDYPQHRKQLTNLFLLLGSETEEALLEFFQDAEASVALRAEIAGVLGMMSGSEAIAEYARNIGNYGLSAGRTGYLMPDQLAVGLRSLGGLLAGGHWNMRHLQELRESSQKGSPAHELFSVLLGWRYEPQITRLESELEYTRQEFKKQILLMTSQMAAAQKHSQSLEDEMEDLRKEHGARADELHRTSRDRETLRSQLDTTAKDRDKLVQDRNAALASLEVLQNERDAALAQLAQSQKERDALRLRLQKALQE